MMIFLLNRSFPLHVNAFAAPGVARLRPYSMAFDFGTNSEIFTSISSIPSHLELRLVYTSPCGLRGKNATALRD
jgi:hypothetical protein